MLPKPNADTWAKRYEAVERFQRVWRTDAALLESLYEQTWVMDGIPDGIPVTVPSTASAIVDEATDHTDFDPTYLQIRTPTFGLSTDAEARASRLKSWLKGWAVHQATRANDVSPYRDFAKNLNLFGKAAYKTFYDKLEWPELEIPAGTSEADAKAIMDDLIAERQMVEPVVLRSLDPRAVFEDTSVGEKRYAIEVYSYEAQEIMPLYSNWLPKSVKNGDMPLDEYNPSTRLSVWDCYQIGIEDGKPGIWHQVLINEAEDTAPPVVSEADPADPEATFLPFEPFPYTVKFSGFGRQSPGSYELRARSILSRAKSLIMAEGRRLTQLDSIMAALAWPTLFVTGPRNRFTVTYGPNVVNYVPPGVTVTNVTPPLPTGPITTALAVLQSGIERATFGSMIRGEKPPNTTSAAQLAILSGQARLRFGSIKVAHEGALQDVMLKALRIVRDVIQERVAIHQVEDADSGKESDLELRPSDIPARPSVQVEIMADPAEEQDRRVQLAHFLFQDGVIDMEEYRERAGIEDTAAMRRRAIRDAVLLKSPAVLQMLGEMFLLESGYDIESLTLEKAIRDMLIMRRKAAAEQEILGGGAGGMNPMGSQPAGQMAPNPLGGAPGEGPTVPSAAMAQLAAAQGMPNQAVQMVQG